MDRSLRVLIVDVQEVVLWGFRSLLSEQEWIDGCLTAQSGDEATRAAARFEPHVAVVDLFVGEESGAGMCGALRRASPTTRVLLMSGVGWISPQAAKAAGASGFVAKDRPVAELTAAIRTVGAGRMAFADTEEPPRAALTPRERQVLALLTTGATNREIADRLHLSPHTVKEHTSGLYRKLSVRNRAQAVQRAERLGLTA